ncbi:MAG: phosphatidate cytidylyltransferase [bacterium]
MGMHTRRWITGLCALPVFLLGIFWDHGDWLAAAVVTGSFFLAWAEMYNLYGIPHRRMLLCWQNCLALLFFVCTVRRHYIYLLSISFLFFWGSCLITIRRTVSGSRYEIATHGLALIYLLYPLACFVYLRSLDNGPSYLFFMLAVACFTDIGGFYGGRWLGRNKLAPLISPNKTWEGAVAGAVFSVVVVLLTAAYQSVFLGYTLWFSTPHHYLSVLILTVLMSAIGQVGDLCESAIKRDAGAKDSGSSFTGHGGFLDMMDAMLWIGPAMLVYVILWRQ